MVECTDLLAADPWLARLLVGTLCAVLLGFAAKLLRIM